MRKIVISLTCALVVLCFGACGQEKDNKPGVLNPVIGNDSTVETSLRELPGWENVDINNLNYSVFPEYNKKDHNYAIVYGCEPSKDGTMPVALVYYKDTHETQDSDNLFKCPGVVVESVEGGLKPDEGRAFLSLPIGESENDINCIWVGYATDGYILCDGVETGVDGTGVLIYVVDHAYEHQFAQFYPKE